VGEGVHIFKHKVVKKDSRSGEYEKLSFAIAEDEREKENPGKHINNE
jgi:hypothetical protein